MVRDQIHELALRRTEIVRRQAEITQLAKKRIEASRSETDKVLSAARVEEKRFRTKLGLQKEFSNYTTSLHKSTIQQELLIEKLRIECTRLDAKIEKGPDDEHQLRLQELPEHIRRKEKRNFELTQKISIMKTKILA